MDAAMGPVENGTRYEDIPSSSMAKTTTISTIAVQSGKTRIVIALLHCGDWISLKILEITPELTTLGNTLDEALELQKAHDEVLRQLQNKQSPVEELLRQADQLIATQKPRAEVYAAMAESLGRAWKDINSTLEIRKFILDLNVLYHKRAEDFFHKSDALDASCKDKTVPIEIETVKVFLTSIHDQRRTILESLMAALQAGNSLLGKLKELGAEGTLDSRPNRIRSSVKRAISQVQGWLDDLHLRRQVLEGTFNDRKTQLEQCLALAILATDLRELEETVQHRRDLLANSNQYGDSSSSAELFLHEHMKLLPEAKQLQERALKITKATEQLVASGCFAGEEASQQSYAVLSSTSDYLTDLQTRESLLERVKSFFRTAQTVLTKLNQLEIQLTATELPKTSPQLVQLHEQCSKAIEDATGAPITEGYAILDIAGRGTAGTEGIQRMVEELENKKIILEGLCTAHKEENIRVNAALNNFLEKHNEIYTWLLTIAEAFLKGHRDMGSDLPLASDFYELHNQLLNDLQIKGNEINTLLLTLPPILEYLEDNQRKDVDFKVEQLHERWMKLKNILEIRMELANIYVKFHKEADIVNKEMDKLDNLLVQNKDNVDDETMRKLEEKFESIVPFYECAKNTGLTFINQAKSISEPHLDTQRACLCVESILERLSGRQLVVTRNWQTFHTEVVEKRELLVRLELTMEESSKTISLVSKLDDKLYPVITTDSNKPKQIADFIEDKLSILIPEVRKSQADVNEKIKTTEALIQQTQNKDETNLSVKKKLDAINQKLQDAVSDYQVLSQVLIGYFRNLEEIEKKVEVYNAELEKTGYPKDVTTVDRFLQEHEVLKQTITERLRFAQAECDQVAERIRKQEPETAAEHDINKLKHVLELNTSQFEDQWRQRQDSLLAHRQISSFDYDLMKINDSIDDLDRQMKNITGQYGEAVSSAKATSQAFGNLEESVQTLEQRIQSFIKSSDKLISENHKESSHVQNEISALQDKWNNLKNQMKTIRNLIDTSIRYFQFVEEADEWFREGSKLLVTIARKSTAIKKPEEAEELLNEISQFLTPGEEKQNERIKNISELAVKLYGQDQSKYAPVLKGNKEMLESFKSIIKELNTLADNLRQAEEERKRAEREKAEAELAEQARQQAEAQRKEEERLAEQARKTEEARLAEERRKAEEARLANEARIAKEKIEAEERRLADEKRKIEEVKIAEQARLAEERRQAEEAKRAEEERLAEERRKLLEEKQRLQQAKIEEEARRAEEAKLAEARRTEESRLAEEKCKLEEIKLKQQEEAERLRLEEERQKAEQAKISELKKHTLEITEITDVHKIEIQNAANKRIPSPIPIVEDASEAPVFVSPLSDAVIEEGNKFTFMCRVTGHPTPIVHWYKAGLSIQNNPDYRTSFQNGLCTLTIEETFAEDSARYTCRATNQAGEDETSAVLSVKENEPEEVLAAPSFVKLLQPSVAKEGTTFQFECQVDGNPLPTVQWYKNSDCIDNFPEYGITYNNGNAILKFEKVGLDDKAEYTCKASNQLGTAQSTANLIITPSEPAEAPIFITPLSNVMARAGQKIKLECEISGLPPPILTWSHNGKTVKETREIKLQQEGNKAILLVLEAFPKDAGTYSIIAKNLAGEATSTCSVSVKGRLPTETSDSEIASDMEPIKPSVQLPLTDTNAKEGTRVRLDCVIVGQPEPEVIWYHDDQPVKESQDFQLLFQGDRCSLIILEVLPEDAGEYKVVALNSAGEASSKCTLSVTESDTEKLQEEKSGTAPKFSKLLTDVLVSEGDKVILEGNVNGEPKPEIKWLLNNLPITDVEHFIFTYDDEGNVRLEINNVKPEDKGVYTVKASNSIGEAKCFAQLIVKSFKPTETVQHEEQKQPPDFKEGFSDRSVVEESSTKFECIVVGKPTPKVKWLFNGEQISGKDFLISTSGNRQVLSIPNAKQQHSGTVTCVAENEVGKATCIANLQVQPAGSISQQENQLELRPILPLSTEKTQHTETSYRISREVVTQSATSHTSKIISTNSEMTQPYIEEHRVSSQKAQTFKQINQETPDVRECQKTEEYHKIGDQPPVFHEKTSTTFAIGNAQKHITSNQELIQKTPSKIRPPKFISPVIGKIVDQDVDVILEGILDGQPTPQIKWTKNGEDIKEDNRLTTTWYLNKTTLEIKNVNVQDAGRYSCTAINEAGTAVSTADLVVRKTIFPPVFGRRLQAQVIKKGDRVVMEVEVTGTPEPTVTWYKDGNLIGDSTKTGYKIKSMGQNHTLTIGKAEMSDSGRFMVRAVNSGGEAQSIADIAVIEPAPDSMVEVVKTVVFEDIKKHETLASAADQISTVESKPVPLKLISNQLSQSTSAKSEVTSTTENILSQEKQIIKLEHKIPDIPMPKQIISKVEDNLIQKQHEIEINRPASLPKQEEIVQEKKIDVQEGIETSSISTQSSLQFFVKKIKEGETPIHIQKELPQPEPIKQDVYKKFESTSPVPTKSETIRHEYQSYTSSQSIQPQDSLITNSGVIKELKLEPEPPAEICYAPKPQSYKKQEVTERIKKISENQKELSPHEVPTGAVRIFPSTQKINEQSLYQTTSSSYSRTFESTASKSTEESSWVTERPKSTTSSYTPYEKLSLGRPLSAQGEPSQEGLIMEKQWAHKFSETHQEKSWPPQQEDIKFRPSWSVDSTLEKKWTPKVEPQTPKQHYIAEVSNLGSIVDNKQILSESMSKSEYIVEENNVKPSEIIKSWPPTETKTFTTIDSLPIRPVSVQDITDEVYLEPGPPPEIAYAPPAKPTIPQRKEWVAPPPKEVPKEWAAPKLPVKHWVAPPPPLPPKQVIPQAPPVPAKPLKHAEQPKKISLNDFTPFEKFPDLEPFPYKPEPQRPKPPRIGPPPTPSKFVKGKFTDSDYESDFESAKISAKWKPAMSDTEEPSYRKVAAPKVNFTRSRSQEPEVLPPSKFEQPPVSQGPPRPEVNIDEFKQVKKLSRHVRDSKRIAIQAPQPVHVPALVKKPDSPKSKQKQFVDGYMADTEYCKDEYTQLLKTSEYTTETQKVVQKPRVVKKTQTFHKELVTTPIVTSQVKYETFPYKPEPEKAKTKVPPPPSPSRFVKGEFRESDYESDYEKKVPAIWGSNQEPSFKPVHPILTPTKQHGQQYGHTPTPPTEFERPPQDFSPARPKFEPIKPEIKPAQKNVVYKPKPISATSAEYIKKDIVLQPGTPPEIAYAPAPKKTQYYKSTVSAPYTNAIQQETSNVVHFNESTENCHRTMSVQQTHKIIKFGDKYKKEEKLEPFPFQPEPERNRRSTSVPPPPTPTKFIPGEFRESDYESEVENTKIKQKWTPRGGEDRNQYRRVRAPAAVRSSSVPAPKDRVLSPMDFDTPPTKLDYTDSASRKHYDSVYRKFTENNNTNLVKRSYSHEPGLKPGSPPEYGYATDQRIVKQTATKVASQHMDSMTQAFKSKTQKFVTDIMEDVNKQKTLKNGPDGDAQVYREESRAAQYGTKHVDPDTGLIYFKYDFGYEFGIILPGEGGKQGGVVPAPKKTVIEPPKRTKDIELPVYHEKTTPNLNSSTQFKSKKFNKSGKWEPTSESEMSDYERDGKGANLLQGSRWEPSSCSPASLSPSLPSTSPAFNNTFAVPGRPQTPPSCPSTPGSIHGKHILNPSQARAPMFITPLRDIAVVAGQAAKFECIVQSEPQPNILWSKNGRIIQDSRDYQLHFRNGVCRLTISQAYPEDAGVYACTATNPVGTANTTATLEVPGVPSHMYGTYRQFTTVKRNISPDLELYKRPVSPGNLPFPIGKSSGLHCLLENYN